MIAVGPMGEVSVGSEMVRLSGQNGSEFRCLRSVVARTGASDLLFLIGRD
jgi:hypothetical protein